LPFTVSATAVMAFLLEVVFGTGETGGGSKSRRFCLRTRIVTSQL
jgi:hypothetical protein